MADLSAPRKLDYAPAPPTRRRVARRIVVGLVIVCAAIFILKLWPAVWLRVQLVYWQSRCLAYTAPPDSVVFVVHSPGGSVPTEWRAFYNLLSPPGARSNGTLFLHERTSRSGNRRLVAVDFSEITITIGDGSAELQTCIPRVIQPGSLTRPPVQIFTPAFIESIRTATTNTRLFAGQVDPQDASHFTIQLTEGPIESPTNRVVLDGWLGDDDSVTLEPRKP